MRPRARIDMPVGARAPTEAGGAEDAFRLPLAPSPRRARRRLRLLTLALAASAGSLFGEEPPGRDAPLQFHLPFPPGATYRVIYGPGDAPHHVSPRNLHACDFDMPLGSEVVAAAAGRVIRAVSRSQGSTGRFEDTNFVALEHSGGLISEYHHLMQDGVLVRPGEWVERGEVIGYSGATGRAEGAHLHFVAVRGERSVPVAFVECGGMPRRGAECTSRNAPPVLEERIRGMADLRRAAEALARLGVPSPIRTRLVAIAWEEVVRSPASGSPSFRRSALALRRLEAQFRAELSLGPSNAKARRP